MQLVHESKPLHMTDCSTITNPAAKVRVVSPFYSGLVHTAVLDNPLFDLVMGNIEGVKDLSVKDSATQIEELLFGITFRAQAH